MSSMWTPQIGPQARAPAKQPFMRLPYPNESEVAQIKDRRRVRQEEVDREAKRDRRREAVENSPTGRALRDQDRLKAAYGNRQPASKDLALAPSRDPRTYSKDWAYYGYRGSDFLRVEDPGERPTMQRGGVGPKAPAALEGAQFRAIEPAPFDSAKHRQNVASTKEGSSIPMPFETQKILADKRPLAKKVAQQATGGIRGAQHGLWTKTQERKWQEEDQKNQRLQTLKKAQGQA